MVVEQNRKARLHMPHYFDAVAHYFLANCNATQPRDIKQTNEVQTSNRKLSEHFHTHQSAQVLSLLSLLIAIVSPRL
jgi:hypothetical protein